jgi:hypothetical protein
VAGTFSAPDVATAPAASSPEAKNANMPDPLSQWSKEAKIWAGQIWNIWLALYKIIGRKRLLYLTGAILLAVAIWHFGVPLFKTLHFHRSQPVVASAPPPEPVKQPRVESQPPVGTLAAKPKPEPAHPMDANPPVSPTTTQYTPSAVPQSSQDKLADAIKNLNTFSNYCFATLAADNALIEKISNDKIHDRLDHQSQRVDLGIGKLLNRQEIYLDQFVPGPEANASIDHSTQNLTADRAAATNDLMDLNDSIQRALQKN